MADSTNTLSGIGARLKAAREAQHLTEKDVAARLNLNSRFIYMMESETFEKNLPETFVRGYIRSYARLLNLNDNEITEAITQLDLGSSVPTPTLSSPLMRIRKEDGNPLDR